MGLYREDAQALTDLFVERAVRGDYDGTAFFAKADRKRGAAPLDVSLRAGHPGTLEAKAFDREAAAAYADEEYGDLMPADSRHLIPADRGVVLAWHDPASIYDGAQSFVVAQQRSPLLDYDYSPIGKLLDEASLRDPRPPLCGRRVAGRRPVCLTDGRGTGRRGLPPGPREDREGAGVRRRQASHPRELGLDEGGCRERRGHPRRLDAGCLSRGCA